MPSDFTLMTPVALPAQSAVAGVYESMNLADAFAIQLPVGTSSDPDLLSSGARKLASPIGGITAVRAIASCPAATGWPRSGMVMPCALQHTEGSQGMWSLAWRT
jgi:hypothetical protein